MHCYLRAWLYHALPNLGKYDFAVFADEVVVSFLDVWANYFDVEEGFVD